MPLPRHARVNPSSLVDRELGHLRPDQASSVTQFARTGLGFGGWERRAAARQSDAVGVATVGMVAWMRERRSAWNFEWLSVQCVRRRRRSSRGTSPVT